MPELPEVETVRRELDAALAGSRIRSVEVVDSRLTRRSPVDASALAGADLQQIHRHGKWLFADLSNDLVWVMHLRMSGQVLLGPPFETSAPTRARVAFDTAGGDRVELRWVDQRRFGEWLVMEQMDADVIAERIGPDAAAITAAQLRSALTGRSARLKAVLTDQRSIGGIGNMYADEILWRAHLSGTRPGDSVDPAESRRRLAAAIRSVIGSALRAGGTSTRDSMYRRTTGERGWFRVDLEVYQREGEPCSRCSAPIQRVKSGSSSSYFCPSCQT